MRCFYYRILLENGRTRRGVSKLAMEQVSSAQIYLEHHWMAVVLSLRGFPTWFNTVFDAYRMLTRKSISRTDLAEFFRSFAVMLSSGIPILDAVEELSTDERSAPATRLAEDIMERLRAGSSLTESMEDHADVVPETVRNLIRIGETSGTLDITMTHAAEHLSRVVHIASDSKRALIYPAFVFFTVLAATTFWVYYVVPSISDLFRQMNVKLPWLTVKVISFSTFVHNHFLIFLLVSMGILVVSILLVKYNQHVRFAIHKLAYYAPVSRVLVRSSALAFITEYLSLLLASGVDIIHSLGVLHRSMANEIYRRKILQIRQSVLLGNGLYEGMRETGEFPGFMLRMVNVGEQTGTLDQQLSYLAGEYRRRFEHVVASLGEIIQPAVMLLVGGLFILMVASLFLPIYQLIGQVGHLH